MPEVQEENETNKTKQKKKKKKKCHKLFILSPVSYSSSKSYLAKENDHGIISMLLVIRLSITGVKSGNT